MADYARDEDRPATPTGSSKTYKAGAGMHALNTNRAPQQTFFDDATPVDNTRGNDSDQDRLRDSHDLSFEGATVRDSVVDNMLLSLDQFSTVHTQFSQPPTSHYSNFQDDDFFLAGNSFPPPQAHARHRGHTYTSSHSSDYDLRDDSSSRYSSKHSRGRRSNSSNNIPNVVSRKTSVREGFSNKHGNGLFGQYQKTGHVRSGGRRGSKGSGSSSMDIGQSAPMSSGHRPGFGNRSASFDHGHMSSGSRISPVKAESILDRSRYAYQNYHDYDAAPQPTIPAGPRSFQEAQPQSPIAYPPQPTYMPPPAPVPRRKGSVRSNTSFKTLRKNKSQPEHNMRLQAQEFVNASNLRDLPPIPTFQDPPAPSPTVATRKHLAALGSPATTPKEKPGFFRKFFGGGSSSKNQPQLSHSSSNHSNASPLDASGQRPADIDSIYSQARPRTTPGNTTTHIASQLKSAPRTAQGAPPPAMPKETTPLPPPPSLAKKPSSFFRRRKKSVSEAEKPPIVPLEFRPPVKAEIPPAQPSPGVSSLRKVMNPYLNDLGSSGQRYYDSREHQSTGEEVANGERLNGFSPGYKPHKDATVRSVKPSSRGTEGTPPSSRGDQVKNASLANTDSPKLKLKMKHNRTNNAASSQEDSFLADSSSCNEDRGASSSGDVSGMESRGPKTSPASTTVAHSHSHSHGHAPAPAYSSSQIEGRNDRKANVSEKRSELLSPRSGGPKASSSGSASPSQSASEVEDDGWILTVSPKDNGASARPSSARPKRVWLDTTTADDRTVDDGDDMTLPLEGARLSQKSFEKASPSSAHAISPTSTTNDVFHSATSLPVVQVETRDSDTNNTSTTSNMPAIVEHRSLPESHPTDSDRERAFRIFNGDDPSVQKAQAAAVLGDVNPTSTRTRKAYMELFDWTGFNILAAMRDLCGKLVLKAETQQVDRILMSLSERWCDCNPHHGFKAVDVVHTICYSILLLNTDLHVADIESRMTRSQFVKNTLPTVTRVCKDSLKAAGNEETLRPQSTQFRRGSLPWNNDRSEPTTPTGETTTFPAEASEEPLEGRRARSRLSVKPPIRSGSDGILSIDSPMSESNTLVNAPYNGPMRGWEMQIETVLKDFYESIRKQRLPLHGASNLGVHEQSSTNNLSVSGMLRRTPSVLSKAPSENMSYRGRSQTDFRSVGNRWVSKTRSRSRLYPTSTVASSRTSLDDGSVWSPAGSSTWSKYSYGKTQTSMSMESLGSHFAHGDYQQAIGFANALSQAIIREEGMTIASSEEFTRVAPLLEDETLELAGAPWAKEGILKHKHHLESLDKKAKDRTWNECFAVIEKGYMRLFSFSANSKSLRHKNKSRPSAGSVVGGGNWMDNAEALDSFLLRQTIASALPPPGYSKSRPHVWALSLPTGAVHLFQVGTPDIVREFVSTANYWSARLSKEPLMGGVSSMEYGWGENVVNPALIRQDSTPSVPGHMPRPSVASSLRSSMDHATGTIKPRLPGDKVALSDWSPPTQSMMASNLMEVDQLRALSDYVKNVEEELARHNELRAPMLIAFSPRHPNAAKAMANWERKSSYLLREIVKFRTYIDSLSGAQTLKDKIYAEREANGEETPELNENGTKALGAHEVDGAKEAPKLRSS